MRGDHEPGEYKQPLGVGKCKEIDFRIANLDFCPVRLILDLNLQGCKTIIFCLNHQVCSNLLQKQEETYKQ